MPTDQAKKQEVDNNYEAFRALLPGLVNDHAGKFVVMRHKKPVEFFDTARDALVFGNRAFNDGIFSVQEVTTNIIDLGWFSHAPSHTQV